MTSLLVHRIGSQVTLFMGETGRIACLFWRILTLPKDMLKRRKLVIGQMHEIGVRSFGLITVVSLFTGAVTAWQAAYQFEGVLPRSLAMEYLGAAVSAAILIELSPVLAGLVVAGRVGASIAAEIGSMKVTEQIDALESLAIDPVSYLALPRFLAGFLMLPALVIYSNAVAHAGGFLVSNAMLGVSIRIFFISVQKHFLLYNVFAGLIKALVFGGGTALIGCSIGFTTEGGASGVGQATIKAFVFSSAFILITDFMLALILF